MSGSGWPGRVCNGSLTSSSRKSGRLTRRIPHTGGRSLWAPTPAGRAAVASLAEAQHAWANAVGATVGEEELRSALATMRRVIGASRAYRQETDTAED